MSTSPVSAAHAAGLDSDMAKAISDIASALGIDSLPVETEIFALELDAELAAGEVAVNEVIDAAEGQEAEVEPFLTLPEIRDYLRTGVSVGEREIRRDN